MDTSNFPQTTNRSGTGQESATSTRNRPPRGWGAIGAAGALIDEWKAVIVREQKRTPEAAARITAAIRDFFDDSKIERHEYEHLIDEMPGVDPADHIHSAAAVVRQPCTVLTRDRNGFPAKPLATPGVRVTDPDTYLCELTDALPEEVTNTIVRLAGEKTRPTKTPHDLLNDLEHAGVPRFAKMIRDLLAASGE